MADDAQDTLREALAEFLGTFVLILFGVGVVAQVVLSRQAAGATCPSISPGLAVTMACYVAGGVSGAHINPAVTLTLAVHRGFSWSKVGSYVLAQVTGAFTAVVVVSVTYAEALAHFDGGMRQVVGPEGTAAIWATSPQPFLGFNSGYAINPARDFSPRLFTAVGGWGADVFGAG